MEEYISQDGDEWTVVIYTKFKNYADSFRIDQEYNQTTFDGRKYKVGFVLCMLLYYKVISKLWNTHTYIHTNIHIYTHTYIHMHACTNTHTYIHTYIHTYMHTYVSDLACLYCWQWTNLTMGLNEQNEHFAELRQKVCLYIHKGHVLVYYTNYPFFFKFHEFNQNSYDHVAEVLLVHNC